VPTSTPTTAIPGVPAGVVGLAGVVARSPVVRPAAVGLVGGGGAPSPVVQPAAVALAAAAARYPAWVAAGEDPAAVAVVLQAWVASGRRLAPPLATSSILVVAR